MKNRECAVRFGRTDQTVIKTNFCESKRTALSLANNVAFLLWDRHPFKASECNQSVRIEQGSFWVEFHPPQEATQ